MDVEIVCKDCKQTIDVDSQATGQIFNCPTCNRLLKIPSIPAFPESPFSSMFCPPAKNAKIEIACAPTAEGKLFDENWRTQGVSSINWYLPVYVARRKVIKVKIFPVEETSFNKGFNTYSVPENVICRYSRYLGTTSRKSESAFFRLSDGEMQILNEGKASDFISLFMKEFADFHVYMA
jgi:hypothetical protein